MLLEVIITLFLSYKLKTNFSLNIRKTQTATGAIHRRRSQIDYHFDEYFILL